MVDVYYPNGVFLLLPLIESLLSCASLRATGIRAVRKLIGQNLVFVLFLLVATFPLYATRKIIFGGYLTLGSYSHLAWDWSAPYWYSVLFSSDHGLVSWTPLLGLALLGLFFAPLQSRTLVLYLATAAVSFFYVISSYPYWDGLSSFGNRFFISLTPIFVFGLAHLLSVLARLVSSTLRSFILFSVILACFVTWNLGFIFQWGEHLIPVRGPISWGEMIRNQFIAVPQEVSGRFRAYILHRFTLMQQIEQRDIDQLKRSVKP
jgi:hypothetical protein